jgi:Flp pilus assembly protein TadD
MKTLERINLILLLLLAAAFATTELAEVDLHWHLLAGRQILATGRAPMVDSFSYVSAGRPWIDLHWLFQVGVALVHRLGGWGGIDLFKIALLVGACGLAGLAARRRGVPGTVVAAVGLPGLVASQERFNLRPEAVSFVLLALVFLLLDRRAESPRALWAIPPVMALWANTHALFAVGLAAIGIVTIADPLERLLRRRPGDDLRGPGPGPPGPPAAPRPWTLPAVALLSAAATCLTPYGGAGWTLPARLLFERIGSDNVYARSIAEFQPTLGGYGVTTAIAGFAVLATVVVVAGLAAGRRARFADLLLVAAFLHLGLLARRNAPLFAIVALPVGGAWIAGGLARIAGRFGAGTGRGERLRPARAAAAILVTALALAAIHEVISNRFFERDGTQRYFGCGASPGFYPETAARFVLDRRLAGEAIHELRVGGYLAWRWFPDRRVFIDGRLEVHDPQLFVDSLNLQNDPARFEAIARRHDVGVVLPGFRPEWAGLLQYLATGHGWRPVHVDLAAAVFVRDDPGADAAGLPALDLRDPELGRRILEEVRAAVVASAGRDPLPRLARRLIPRREVPVAEANAALFFAMAGAHANAELLFREAIRKAPTDPRLHYDLGLVLDRAGRRAAARHALETALAIDPRFAAARVARALFLSEAGDEDGALRDWTIADRRGALGPRSLQARGAILARRGRIDEAIEDYRRAVRLEPANGRLRAGLAMLYQKQGLRTEAEREIGIAAASDPEGCASRAALAHLRDADGAREVAIAIYREVLGTRPACPEAVAGLSALLIATGRKPEAVAVVVRALVAGLDRKLLSADPVLRILQAEPEVAAAVAGGGQVGTEEERQP